MLIDSQKWIHYGWLYSLKSHSIRKYVYILKRHSLLVLIHDIFSQGVSIKRDGGSEWERKLEHTQILPYYRSKLQWAKHGKLVIIYQQINIKLLFASNTFKEHIQSYLWDGRNGKDSYYTIPPYIKWLDRKTQQYYNFHDPESSEWRRIWLGWTPFKTVNVLPFSSSLIQMCNFFIIVPCSS